MGRPIIYISDYIFSLTCPTTLFLVCYEYDYHSYDIHILAVTRVWVTASPKCTDRTLSPWENHEERRVI